MGQQIYGIVKELST